MNLVWQNQQFNKNVNSVIICINVLSFPSTRYNIWDTAEGVIVNNDLHKLTEKYASTSEDLY